MKFTSFYKDQKVTHFDMKKSWGQKSKRILGRLKTNNKDYLSMLTCFSSSSATSSNKSFGVDPEVFDATAW